MTRPRIGAKTLKFQDKIKDDDILQSYLATVFGLKIITLYIVKAKIADMYILRNKY